MSASGPETVVGLTELQQDAFTELVNIGVSRAAASLRKMIGNQVLLSVPSVEIVSREAAARLIGEREAAPLVVVHQDFEGAFAGRALLIFPQENGRELVRAVAGEELSPEEVAALEDEALAERERGEKMAPPAADEAARTDSSVRRELSQAIERQITKERRTSTSRRCNFGPEFGLPFGKDDDSETSEETGTEA